MPRSEDFDSYLSALGVPYLAKKMAASSSPSLKVERDGEFWVVTFKAMMKTNEMRFKIGKQFTTKTPNGEEVRELFSIFINFFIIYFCTDEDNRQFSRGEPGLE